MASTNRFLSNAAFSAIIGATLGVGGAPHANDEDPRFNAMALVSLGEYARACDIIDANYAEDIADADIQFLRGRCREGQGEYTSARSAFEQVLAIDPNANQARIYIANTYAAEGDRRRARNAYQAVLDASPPSSIRRSVANALAALDAGKNWFASAGLSALYDSNYNSGPADSEIFAFGLPFTLAADNLEQQSFGYQAELSGGYAWPLGENKRAVLQGGVQHSDYEERGAEFDSQIFWGSLAVSGAIGGVSYTIAPRVTQTLLDYDAFRFSAGGDVRLQYEVSSSFALIASAGARTLNYASLEDRDGSSVYVSPGFSAATPLGRLSANYNRSSVEADAEFRSFNSNGTRVQLVSTIGRMTVSPFYQYRQSDYDGVEPGFGVTRQDDAHEVGLFVRQPLNDIGLKRTALQLRYSYADNDSNVDLYDFERHRVSIGVVKRW